MTDKYDTRPANSYPEDVKREIRLLTFNKADKDDIQPVGSFAYRIQKYPSDIDLREPYVLGDTEETLVKKFIKDLKRVTRNILSDEPDSFFVEFKAGIDDRYELEGGVGKMTEGKFHKNPDLIPFARGLKAGGLLSAEELDTIKDSRDYEELHELIRQKMTIRWTSSEVLKGSKRLDDGMKISLEDALEAKSVVKIDVMAWIEGKYKEVSNFLLLGYMEEDDDGTLVPLNADYNFLDRDAFVDLVRTEIPLEVERLLYTKDEDQFSPFKAIKRMFSLARLIKDKDMLDTLAPIIESNVSLLYQIKGDLGGIQMIMEQGWADDTEVKHRIKQELGEIKEQLSGVTELKTDTVEHLDDLLDQGEFDKIMDYLGKVINARSVAFLREHDLVVPPHPYLLKNKVYKRKLRFPNGKGK